MKKNVLVGLLLVSSLSFARGYENHQEKHLRKREICAQENFRNKNFSNRNNQGQKFGNLNMPEALKKELYLKRIKIDEYKLSVKRLLAETNVDWIKVSEINKKIGIIQGECKTKIQNFRHNSLNNQNKI